MGGGEEGRWLDDDPVACFAPVDSWTVLSDSLVLLLRLKRDGITNVGIVFSFHHWRGSQAEFPVLCLRIQPYLIAFNLNGMRADTSQYPGVRYIGSDESEIEMTRVVEASGWRGPISVIHERPTVGAAEGIKGNFQGLEWIQKEMRQPG